MGLNVVQWLCLKYSCHPFSVWFTAFTIADMEVPLVRFVFARIVSLSFLRLFFRGQRFPPSK